MLLAASTGEDLLRAVLQGAPPGSVYALIALGFVLTYKTSGVFNLAFGAQAYVSAAMYFQARNEWEWQVVPALILAVFILAPLIGLVLERLIFRHLSNSSAVAKLVIAIGLSVALPSLFELVTGFSAVAGRTPTGIIPGGSSVFYDPFGIYPLSRDELAQMAVALFGMAALGVLFRFSSLGLALRAVVESPRMTELSGINADRVSAFAWALSSLFAGMAGVLIAPRFNTLMAPDFFHLVIVAIAAAAVGRLASLPRALLGGLGLGIFIALFNTFLPRWTADHGWLRPFQENLTPSMPFVILFGVLVCWPAIRGESTEWSTLWAGWTHHPRDLPPLNPRNRRLTLATRVFSVSLFCVIGVTVLLRADVRWLFLVTQAGDPGHHLPLHHGGYRVRRTDLPLPGSFRRGRCLHGVPTSRPVRPVGARRRPGRCRPGCCCRRCAVAARPQTWRRLAGYRNARFRLLLRRGHGQVLLDRRRWNLALPRNAGSPSDYWPLGLCRRPPVPGPRALVAFTVVSFLVIQLREGTTGRMLHALRGSEMAAESIGISPVRARVTAFAVSAAIAGFGGALLAIHQENVNYQNNFSPTAALFWLVLVVSLSARTIEGAAYSGAAYSLFDSLVLRGEVFRWIFGGWVPGILPISPKWRFVLFGLASIQFSRHPEGLVEYGKRRPLVGSTNVSTGGSVTGPPRKRRHERSPRCCGNHQVVFGYSGSRRRHPPGRRGRACWPYRPKRRR
ncbi:MAG: hypothetical protein CM1200mP26_19580 [Acidimicrobiales bacterium]|nr:MAG: hypothetical protein CM1200mP26_19580 [Acidimicrobiales bacterium]